MRSIITLSLPSKLLPELKRRVKRFGFGSVSEYIRTLLELDNELISESALVEMARQAKRDYAAGRLKKYTSLSQLDT